MKKLLVNILILSVVLGLFTGITAFAGDDTPTPWDGTAVAPASGTGTSDDPILISNAEELAWLVRQSEADTKGKFYQLENDIYVNEPAYGSDGFTVSSSTARQWPKGSVTGADAFSLADFGAFAGTLDGQGYRVIGLHNSWAPVGYWGLFGTLAAGATVKNVNIDSAYYKRNTTGWTYDTYAAGIAGRIGGGKVTVKGCTNYKSTFADQNKGWTSAAGIVGISYGNREIVIDTCGSYVTFVNFKNADSNISSGILGDNWGSDWPAVNVKNCWSNCYLAGNGNTNGGRVGYSNCYSMAGPSGAAGTAIAQGITVVSGAVTGDDAKTTMPDLGWNGGWSVVEASYPIPTVVRNYKVTFDISEVEATETIPNMISVEGKVTLPDAPEGYHWMYGGANVAGEIEVTENMTIKAEAHCGGTATCAEKAKCEVCGEEYGELSATHGPTEVINQKDADCNSVGYTGDEVCSICKAVIKSGTEIPKTVHNYVEGECTICHNTLEVSGDPNPNDSKYVSDGNSSNNSGIEIPKTGVKTAVILVFSIMAIYAVAASLFYLLNKRQKQENSKY